MGDVEEIGADVNAYDALAKRIKVEISEEEDSPEKKTPALDIFQTQSLPATPLIDDMGRRLTMLELGFDSLQKEVAALKKIFPSLKSGLQEKQKQQEQLELLPQRLNLENSG